MKVTRKNKPLAVGTVVVLPEGETLCVKEVYKEPDDYYYLAQFVEDDGEDYISIGDPRVVAHMDLIGGEI